MSQDSVILTKSLKFAARMRIFVSSLKTARDNH